MADKKTYVFYILNILRKYTDDDTYITKGKICAHLKNDYGIVLNRKTVSSCIDLLMNLDNQEISFEIEHDVKHKNRYHLINRVFDLSQIYYLIDAVFSSKTIDSAQTNELIDRLFYFYPKLKEKLYLKNTIKHNTNRGKNYSDVFYNISIVNEAIDKKKKIRFKYFNDYSDKEQQEKEYIANPFFTYTSNGVYFAVLGFGKEKLYHYKLYMMKDLEMINENAQEFNELSISNNFNLTDYIKEHYYAFSGDVIVATIKMSGKESFVKNAVCEWFGEDVEIKLCDDGYIFSCRAVKEFIVCWVLQYAKHATLLTPSSVVEEIKEIILSMSERYNLTE